MEERELPPGGRNRGKKTMWGKQHRGKKVHLTREDAIEHIIRLARRIGVEECYHMTPYPCRWGDSYEDGRVGLQHWHVGHNAGYGRTVGHKAEKKVDE